MEKIDANKLEKKLKTNHIKEKKKWENNLKKTNEHKKVIRKEINKDFYQ